jgi:hypothetical protein
MIVVRDQCGQRTNGADDAGPPEGARGLVLGIEVGDPFCSSAPVVLVGERVRHLVSRSGAVDQGECGRACCSVVLERSWKGPVRFSVKLSARRDLMRKVLVSSPSRGVEQGTSLERR